MDEIETSREYFGQAQANNAIGEEAARIGGVSVFLALKLIVQNGNPTDMMSAGSPWAIQPVSTFETDGA
jgi:hypothetical protein